MGNRLVRVEWGKTDRYGRLIGTVYHDNQNINRRLVDPSSREAALFSRRALRQRKNKVGLRTRRPVIGSQVRSSNELAKLLRSAG
ncbi:thermonuclease family protein [Thiolapillus sp.]|uniref:thermonuclease family protein n=1 Tax=Thiolapillus sp. TaxID=2017437 RepID=UPI003AF916B8